MALTTSIQWSDSTWSPLRARVREDAQEIATAKGYTSLLPILERIPVGKVGHHCEHASPGCEQCYSETNNARCLPANGTGLPFDRRSRDLVEMFIDEKMLVAPLKWKRGRKIFVESQSDLFGEFVPDELIDRVFAVMALCPQHTFQVLTKRAGRMREYFAQIPIPEYGPDVFEMAGAHGRVFQRMVDMLRTVPAHALNAAAAWQDRHYPTGDGFMRRWPLPNVWLGVSCEDQQRADERIPHLLQTPASVRFVSYEPALGPVDFRTIQLDASSIIAQLVAWRRARGEVVTEASIANYPPTVWIDALTGVNAGGDEMPALDWIIVGGESGPGARPMDIAWVRSVIAQCKAAKVACFVKQLGRDVRDRNDAGFDGDTPRSWPMDTAWSELDAGYQGAPVRVLLDDRKGGDMDEWPADLRVREMPEVSR